MTASESVVAVIDIGTSSWTLLVVRLHGNGKYSVLTEQKEQVRLVSGADFSSISDEARQRALKVFARFNETAAAYSAPIRAVATAGLRAAKNGDDLIQAVHQRFGVTVDVISGDQEARLVYQGVQQSLPAHDAPVLCIDIGGGSTEVIVGHHGATQAAVSVPLGHLKLLETCMPGLRDTGVVSAEEVAAARAAVRAALAASSVSRIAALKGAHTAAGLAPTLVGTAGTIKTLGKVIDKQRDSSARGQMGFSTRELDALFSALLGTDRAARLDKLGVKKKRVDTVISGAILLQELLSALHAEHILISTTSLREGIIMDVMKGEPIGVASPPHYSHDTDGHLPAEGGAVGHGLLDGRRVR